MTDIETVLVVILSIMLAIFLLLGIVVTAITIKILSNIRHITQRIDETTASFGDMAKYFGKNVGPAMISALVAVVSRKARSGFKRKKRD